MMQTKGHLDIPVTSVAKDITINVKLTGLRRWHLRLRLGLALMRLAIWVSGMGFKVEDSELPPLPDPNRPSDKALRRMFPPEFIDKMEGPEDASNRPS